MKCNEKKKAVVSDYLKGQDTIREIAGKYGVSKSTVANWVNEHGLENPAIQGKIDEVRLDHWEEGCRRGGKESSRSKSVSRVSKMAEKLFGGRKATRGLNYSEYVIKRFGGRKLTRGTLGGEAKSPKKSDSE